MQHDHDEHHHWHLTWMGSDRLFARSLARPVARFLRIEAAGGVLLLAGALAAVVWANSPLSSGYQHLWTTPAGFELGSFNITMGLREWVNDGLMALFFFVAGMEIKREMVSGELRDPKAAAMPIVAAIGGVLVPALIYTAFNLGGSGSTGWGIPMATDIAFAVGIVSLLGSRVPVQAKLFLLTLAVADDLVAIAVIAAFYSHGLLFAWLAASAAMLGLAYLLRRAQVWYVGVYVVLGVLAWYFMLRSGVHATVAGVAMGLLVPTKALNAPFDAEAITDRLENQPELSVSDVRTAAFRIRESVPVGERLTDALHPWTGFVIIPIFALANAGVPLGRDALAAATSSPVTLGAALGLMLGKTVGVCGAAYLASAAGIARLPRGTTFLHMLGISVAAGIGFTVALFITALSFADAGLQDQAKIGIFAASIGAAVLSSVVLWTASRRVSVAERRIEEQEEREMFEEEPANLLASATPESLPAPAAPATPAT